MKARIGHTALTWNVLNEPPRLAGAIGDCSALGYQATETAGRIYDWWENERPGELRRLLRESGVLMACLFHTGDWTDPDMAASLIDNGRRWGGAVKALGGEVLMLVPGRRRDAPPYGLDEFQVMAEAMNQLGRRVAQEAGITAVMHPHWGTVVESRLEIELLLSQLDPLCVQFAPDTGQIAKGGTDPMPIIDRWAARVRHVHLKDLSSEWEDMRRAGVPLRSPEGYVELGDGIIDLGRLIPILEKADYGGWLMVELDETKRSPRESAARSKQYLQERLHVFGGGAGRGKA